MPFEKSLQDDDSVCVLGGVTSEEEGMGEMRGKKWQDDKKKKKTNLGFEGVLSQRREARRPAAQQRPFLPRLSRYEV